MKGCSVLCSGKKIKVNHKSKKGRQVKLNRTEVSLLNLRQQLWNLYNKTVKLSKELGKDKLSTRFSSTDIENDFALNWMRLSNFSITPDTS